MKLERISDLRIGDVIRNKDHAFVVADVTGNQATICRTQLLTVPDGWEVVSRAMQVDERLYLLAEIDRLRTALEAKE